MGDRFSFDDADNLLQTLTQVHSALDNRSHSLMALYKQLGSAFWDEGYNEVMVKMSAAYNTGQETWQQLGLVIAYITKYREELYRLYMEDLITQCGMEKITYETTVMFGKAGEELERKNRQLAFQNEVKAMMRDKNVPTSVKELYAKVGSKCVVDSDKYRKTAYYNLRSGAIKFNLEADLANGRGALATYFHEVGHMIDHQTFSDHWLSDDQAFADAIRADAENYFRYTENRFGCDREDAYYHVTRELAEDHLLHAAVSDIFGGLTGCRCQGLFGHSRWYWRWSPDRLQREAFAHMVSTSFGSQARVDVMKKYFPTAYARFEEIIGGLQ